MRARYFSSEASGTSLAVLSALSAAPIGLFSLTALRAGMSPVELAFWRAALASPAFLLHAVVARAPGPSRRQATSAAVLGAVGFTALFASYQWALGMAGLALGTALAESAPCLVVPLSVWILRERWTMRCAVGAGLIALGTALACSARGDVRAWGIAAGVLAALVYAAFYIASARLIADSSPVRVMMIAVPACAASLAPWVRWRPAGTIPWGSLFVLAIVSTYIAYLTKAEALARIGPARVAALGALEPLLALTLAVALGGEKVGWLFGIGTALEILGIGLVARDRAPNGLSCEQRGATRRFPHDVLDDDANAGLPL